MQALSLIAQKGGTGKTSLSIHLAVQAIFSGLKVLLVDTDPQASATAWWGRRRQETPELIQCPGKHIAGVLDTAAQQAFDLVVIDTAPHSSREATACASHSDWVYIPTRPAILDLDAIGATTALVSKVGVSARIVLNCCPPATRYGEPQIVREARQAVGVYGIPVCDPVISQRAAFSHALIDGRAVTEFDRKGKAAIEMDQLWNCVRQEMSL